MYICGDCICLPVRYHFLKYRYYREALEKLVGPDSRPDILIISCSGWNTNNYHMKKTEHWPTLCASYTRKLSTWLEERGHKVRTDCGTSPLHDLSRMARAKYLIGGGCTSSMSYVAMLASTNRAVFASM